MECLPDSHSHPPIGKSAVYNQEYKDLENFPFLCQKSTKMQMSISTSGNSAFQDSKRRIFRIRYADIAKTWHEFWFPRIFKNASEQEQSYLHSPTQNVTDEVTKVFKTLATNTM